MVETSIDLKEQGTMKIKIFIWRIITLISLLVTMVAMIQVGQLVAEHGILLFISKWGIPFYILLFLLVLFLLATWTKFGQRVISKIDECSQGGTFPRYIVICFLFFLVLFYALNFIPFPIFLHQILDRYSLLSLVPKLFLVLKSAGVRIMIFWFTVVIGTISIRIYIKNMTWFKAMGSVVLSMAVLYTIIVRCSGVNNYPFALGWSDASRYYGASLFFAKRIYGEGLPLPAMHPTWHLLLSLPYVFGDLPVWIHRSWSIVLQLGLPAAVGLILARRLNLANRLCFWVVSATLFLFLMQINTILPHLMLCFLIVLLGVSPRRFLRTTLIVLFASLWAGLSRLNWFPVPGLTAALLYLLEISRDRSKTLVGYVWKPAFWILSGTGIAFGANAIYNKWSGNSIPGGQFSSSLTSDLLWYRLFPNASNMTGILPSIVLVSMPVLLIIFFGLFTRNGQMHPVRIIGLGSILGVLFLGGLVVSIKIGGGSDLHNMDAYLILLMLTGSYIFFSRWSSEGSLLPPSSRMWMLAALAIVLPIWMAVQSNPLSFVYNRVQANEVLSSVRERAIQVTLQGSDVLFISQRHLLSFQMVTVPLIPEYEQDYLMEMVMSQNRTYLDRFHADLQAQRFGLIVAGKQQTTLQGSGHSYGEENDYWVQEVSIPLLCYYELIEEPVINSVALYVPREQSCK
jgi:hypothetical protein